MEAHKEFINSVLDVNKSFYATSSSDFTVNLWSKSSFDLIETFDMGSEAICMARTSNDILIVG